jgi:hypothetical protein
MTIIMHLMGGLGNQMFQYALGRRIQHVVPAAKLYTVFEDRYRLASRSYSLNAFRIKSTPAPRYEIRRVGPERKVRRYLKKMMGMKIEGTVYREQAPFVFDSQAIAVRDSTYFIGFWQSYEYFDSIRRELLQDFTLASAGKVFNDALAALSPEKSTLSVHIRRSDYLNPASGFRPLPLSYYYEALDFLKSRVGEIEVLVFSDDPTWAMENLGKGGYRHMRAISGTGLTDAEEMVLMSKCNHHIIANSSFSWWGAWLNADMKKIVVAPKYWNGSDLTMPTKDLIPLEWTQL